MARRLPGGYGPHQDYVQRAESRFVRESLQDNERGWLVSTVGDSTYLHHDVTGVNTGVNVLRLWRVPERNQTVMATQVRVTVAAAVATSRLETALYVYESGVFRKLPGTLAKFDTATTGLKTYNLPKPAKIPKNAEVFLAVIGRTANPTLEGFQAGTAQGRPVRFRTVASWPGDLAGYYELDATTVSATADVPMVVYLSRDAALVL